MIYFRLPSVRSERMTLIDDCIESFPILFWPGCLGDEVLIVLENHGVSGSKIESVLDFSR